jgi:hypothetical protein
MLPSSPSDLLGTVLSPLVQQLEALGQVLEVCTFYYSWCAGCAAGLALLLLTGLVLEETRDGGSEPACHEDPGGGPEPQRLRVAEPLEAEPDG